MLPSLMVMNLYVSSIECEDAIVFRDGLIRNRQILVDTLLVMSSENGVNVDDAARVFR